MQRGVYSAAAGMIASEQWLEVVANNLANASTTGFKREEVTFNEGLLRLMHENSGKGKPIGELGAGPELINTHTIWESGSFLTTGNPLEVAIRGERGLFAVNTPEGQRYTRAGSFTLNNQKELVTQQGHQVLDATGQPIRFEADATNLHILETGQVMAGDTQVAQLGVWDGNATKMGGNLFRLENPQAIANPNLVSGAIESSNVNPVEQMISMIKLHRVFEMAQKSATSQDEATSGLIQSMGRP